MSLTLLAMCIVAAGSATARRNIDAGLKSLKKAGADPASDHCCIDIGAGKKFAVVSVGRVPTLTAGRCSSRGWWLTKACSSVQIESIRPIVDRSVSGRSLVTFCHNIPQHWMVQEHRRMTVAEMARLQGFRTGDLPWKAAQTPLSRRGHQVGNSMSVPVLQEAIRAVLTAADLM